MNLIYADCFSGISGDMLLGAFIELGIDKDWLQSELSSIGIPPFILEIKKIMRGAINCTQCRIIAQEPQKVKRGIREISELINKSNLKQTIKDQALNLFLILADVEAKIHNIPVTDVHFHELGAIDTIVEIIGVLIGYDFLNIDRFYSSPLPLGRGIINTQHGPIPIPSPATVELLKDLPVIFTDSEHELVTPTGALLIKHLAKKIELQPKMVIKKIAYGAGERDLNERPNCLRLIWGETDNNLEEEYIEVIECEIDDMNPEFYPRLMEGLINSGALDVTLSQIIMKKGRPGVKVTVLSAIDSTKRLSEILLTETSTIGLRINKVKRFKASRKVIKIQTQYGPVKCKCAWKGDDLINIAPEFEDYSKISRIYNRPIKLVYQEIIAEALKQIVNLIDNNER
ncbi:MAG: nickel pincer cofactor biosynthesis protein LarC [bacterium]